MPQRRINENPGKGIKKIEIGALEDTEVYAKKLGVSRIAYTNVNPDFIFQDFEILYDSAIILCMEKDKERIDSNPSLESSKEILRTYLELGTAVNSIADFLRERGYNCMASHSMGGCINTVPVAIDANIGYIGRNGLLISPDFGPST